jgi:hypothetical protein
MWAMAVGLSPGLVLAATHDLSDCLATAAGLAALLAWTERRPRATAAWLTLSVLSREPMLLLVLALGLDAGRHAMADGVRGTRLRLFLRRVRPDLVVPVACFAAWQAYVAVRFGGVLAPTTTPPGQFAIPFTGVVADFRSALDGIQARPVTGVWDLAYVVLMIVAIVASLWRLRWSVTASGLAAALFGTYMLLIRDTTLTMPLTYARYSAPLFVCLALSGLESPRGRSALWPTGAAAALMILAPLAGRI